MHYSLMGKMRQPFINSDCFIEVPFKAGLIVHVQKVARKFHWIIDKQNDNHKNILQDIWIYKD